jgi:hypothetical protein
MSNLSSRRSFQTLGDFAAVLIGLHRDALHVDSGGRGIFVIECFLRFDETAGLFNDDPRVSMSGLMQMDVLYTRSRSILLQVIGK